MSLPYLVPGFPGYQEFYGKLHRDHARLLNEKSSDSFVNFIITANQLRDWVRASPEIDKVTKERVKNDLETAALGSELEFLRVCKNLADGGKHFVVTKHPPIIKRVSWPLQSWYGTNGVNSSESYVELNDGRTIFFLNLAQMILNYWYGVLGWPTHVERMA